MVEYIVTVIEVAITRATVLVEIFMFSDKPCINNHESKLNQSVYLIHVDKSYQI
jgi:hypothetical protein